MGYFTILILLLPGIYFQINAQERYTTDGLKCEFPFTYNDSIINDCISIDGQESCQVGSEYKMCQQPSPSNYDSNYDNTDYDYTPTDNYNDTNNNNNNNKNSTNNSNCSRPTKAGCKCLSQWTHMGRVQEGCASPDADPNGPWCLIEENSCLNGDPFGKNSTPQFDYCVEDCASGNLLPKQIQGRNMSDCSVTQGYCICQEKWSYRGKEYESCANPDSDSIGSWCIIKDDVECTPRGNLRSESQASSIMFFLFGLPTSEGSPQWDYCQPSCGPQNQQNQASSLLQMKDISIMGVFDKQGLPKSAFSSLPDLPEYMNLENQQNNNKNYSQQNTKQSDQNYLQQQNYQQQDQEDLNNDSSLFTTQFIPQESLESPPSKQLPPPSPPPPPPPPSQLSQEIKVSPAYNIDYYIDVARSISFDENNGQQLDQSGVCLQTKNGCNCRSDGWNWDGDGDGILGWFLGCARTLDQNTPWCQINNVSECTSTPFSGSWDYCEDSCALPTYGACNVSMSGCRCKDQWQYDGMQQQGCTRPDAELEYDWCVVDESSCTDGRPEGQLNTGELWDRCPQIC